MVESSSRNKELGIGMTNSSDIKGRNTRTLKYNDALLDNFDFDIVVGQKLNTLFENHRTDLVVLKLATI